MAFTSNSSGPLSEINVTPMVDVMLVLLIIFMVVTPMLSRGVKVHLPETVHHERRQDTGEQVVVCVDEHGKVFVGAEPAEGEQFFVKLKRELGAGREVHVKADRKLEYGTVRAVLEKIHAAGAGKVSLGTDEKKASTTRAEGAGSQVVGGHAVEVNEGN